MQYDADFYEGAAFHQREFVLNALLIWGACGGDIGYSRNPLSGKLPGPLIRYLTFACSLVMGEDASSAETLRDYIRDFKKLNPIDKMWNPLAPAQKEKKQAD